MAAVNPVPPARRSVVRMGGRKRKSRTNEHEADEAHSASDERQHAASTHSTSISSDAAASTTTFSSSTPVPSPAPSFVSSAPSPCASLCRYCSTPLPLEFDRTIGLICCEQCGAIDGGRISLNVHVNTNVNVNGQDNVGEATSAASTSASASTMPVMISSISSSAIDFHAESSWDESSGRRQLVGSQFIPLRSGVGAASAAASRTISSMRSLARSMGRSVGQVAMTIGTEAGASGVGGESASDSATSYARAMSLRTLHSTLHAICTRLGVGSSIESQVRHLVDTRLQHNRMGLGDGKARWVEIFIGAAIYIVLRRDEEGRRRDARGARHDEATVTGKLGKAWTLSDICAALSIHASPSDIFRMVTRMVSEEGSTSNDGSEGYVGSIHVHEMDPATFIERIIGILEREWSKAMAHHRQQQLARHKFDKQHPSSALSHHQRRSTMSDEVDADMTSTSSFPLAFRLRLRHASNALVDLAWRQELVTGRTPAAIAAAAVQCAWDAFKDEFMDVDEEEEMDTTRVRTVNRHQPTSTNNDKQHPYLDGASLIASLAKSLHVGPTTIHLRLRELRVAIQQLAMETLPWMLTMTTTTTTTTNSFEEPPTSTHADTFASASISALQAHMPFILDNLQQLMQARKSEETGMDERKEATPTSDVGYTAPSVTVTPLDHAGGTSSSTLPAPTPIPIPYSAFLSRCVTSPSDPPSFTRAFKQRQARINMIQKIARRIHLKAQGEINVLSNDEQWMIMMRNDDEAATPPPSSSSSSFSSSSPSSSSAVVSSDAGVRSSILQPLNDEERMIEHFLLAGRKPSTLIDADLKRMQQEQGQDYATTIDQPLITSHGPECECKDNNADYDVPLHSFHSTSLTDADLDPDELSMYLRTEQEIKMMETLQQHRQLFMQAQQQDSETSAHPGPGRPFTSKRKKMKK